MHMRNIDTLLDSLENGHMIMDDKFIIKYWNSWLSINTKIAYEEIIGKSLEEFFPELNYHVLQRKMRTALKLGTPSFYDPASSTKFIPIDRNKITTSSQNLMQQQVTITPYLKDKNLVMISLYDISELHETKLLLKKEIQKVNTLNTQLEVRVNEALETNKKQIQHMIEQSRMAQMGEMISMIAHQWRQPLSAISSTAINIKLKSDLKVYDLQIKEEAVKYEVFVNNGINAIDEFVQSLSKTIDDFRNFFKPNKRSVILNVKEPIKKALNIIKASIVAEGISINEIFESEIEISMNDSELMQVFLNIFQNAQDNFLEKDIKESILSIRTYDKDNDVIVEITDNGGGIEEDSLDDIFEAYYSTKGKNGTGLGLYMSKIIVEEHHEGKLDAQNTTDGICFRVKLPKQ